MFTIYAEKEIFEELVVFNEEKPNWFKIICNHADVCLNMTDDELNAELYRESPISLYVNLSAGRTPIALKDYFDVIYEDNSQIAEKPRAVFFLDCDKNEAERMQKDYGVFVFSKDNIDDNALRGTFKKGLKKNNIIDGNNIYGWNNLITFKLPPSNALVITDNHLFANTENRQNIGQTNLIRLLDILLPKELKTKYHITVFAREANNLGKDWCENMTNNLKASIKSLRHYDIVFEILFVKTVHDRDLVLNYAHISSTKGFAIFKINDPKQVRDDYKFTYDRVFNTFESHEGDTSYQIANKILIELKQTSIELRNYLNNVGQSSNRRILGDCNDDYSLKNRLLNDV